MTEGSSKFPQNMNEIDEDSPEVQEAIESLRTLVQEEKNLHVRLDDRYMLRHLYGAKFDVQLAFKKLQNYYQLKAEERDWFSRKQVTEYKDVINLRTHVGLPDRDRLGRRVILVKMGNIDVNHMTAKDMTKLDEMWLETYADEPETQRCGSVTITDMSGYTFRNLGWMSPSNLSIGARILESLPNQDHEHHIINTSMFLSAVLNLIFPFMNQHAKDKVFFHYQDLDSLHKHINPEILPEEYGGTQLPVDYEAQYKKLLYDQEDKLWNSFQQGYVTEE